MAEITAKDVKTLRDRTGAGMMDCKKALLSCDGNIEEAIDFLRKKGLAAAAKKAGRVTAEGLVGVYVNGTKGTIIEVNSETDFVARNDLFQKYISDSLQTSNEKLISFEDLANIPYPESSRTFAEELTNLISIIGENLGVRRLAHMTVCDGIVASYVHNKTTENMGNIGILLAIESTGDKAKLLELGHKISMHIAATNAQATNIEDLDPILVEKEKTIAIEQAKNMGKPAEFVEKIAQGRLRKYYEEVVLLEQTFVMDGNTQIKQVIADFAKELGTDVKITGFKKYILGEGIEKKEQDFASEVAAQLN